jgi:hypothetical protein
LSCYYPVYASNPKLYNELAAGAELREVSIKIGLRPRFTAGALKIYLFIHTITPNPFQAKNLAFSSLSHFTVTQHDLWLAAPMRYQFEDNFYFLIQVVFLQNEPLQIKRCRS